MSDQHPAPSTFDVEHADGEIRTLVLRDQTSRDHVAARLPGEPLLLVDYERDLVLYLLVRKGRPARVVEQEPWPHRQLIASLGVEAPTRGAEVAVPATVRV